MSLGQEQVILVNESDTATGTMNKLEAHRQGALHRAFSVFILNERNEMLLQQRAEGKYHSSGLWSNACCSHPMPGEETPAAAHRRLQEEMGFDCALTHLFNFRYRSDVGGGLIENEFDHIFIGRYNGSVRTNPEEVQGHKFISLPELKEWMNSEPQLFTAWFLLVLPQFLERLQKEESA